MGKISNIDVLIALIHILDHYETMINDWRNIEKHNDEKTITNFGKISEGKKVFGYSKIKKFYRTYHDDIDQVKKYTDLSSFYSDYQKKTLDDFYQYFIMYREEIDNILRLLMRLHELGIDKLDLDETLNVANYEYAVKEDYESNYDINYLANIYIIPNYQHLICYRSSDSPYVINIPVFYNSLGKTTKITLNSLFFDVDLLPDTIDGKDVLNKLKDLKEQERDNCSKIRTAVNFSVGIKDFYDAFDSLYKCIGQLDIASKDELDNILMNIKNYIEMLRVHYITYEASVIKSEGAITSEMLEKEKEIYMQLRLRSL